MRPDASWRSVPAELDATVAGAPGAMSKAPPPGASEPVTLGSGPQGQALALAQLSPASGPPLVGDTVTFADMGYPKSVPVLIAESASFLVRVDGGAGAPKAQSSDPRGTAKSTTVDGLC